MFRALLVEKDEHGHRCSLQQLSFDSLPSTDVTVRVEHSTVNYKDALAITGKGAIIRTFPLVPGIDFAGRVTESADSRFAVGDRVVATGFGLGVDHWGGLSEYARVPGDWLIKVPETMSTWEAMTFGTAGVTAMLSIIGIENHGIGPERGPVLVTGAGGGVGGLSIQLLSKLGYRVVAATGRMSEAAYLKRLGASEIIDRRTLSEPGKPMAKARWAAAIDNAGSHTLANVCAGLMDDGIVMSCGMAQGLDFPGSIAPFVLRGITIAGINSVNRSMALRETVWKRLAELSDKDVIASMVQTIPLDLVPSFADQLLNGAILGRLIVDCKGEAGVS